MSRRKRASGCLFGLALGDALGAETEFLSVHEIINRFPPDGPLEPRGNPARVTDDTQMAIAVGEALLDAAKQNTYTPTNLELSLRRSFVEWLNSPENNRAPGMTCLDACRRLEEGYDWQQATVSSSKGCGANMRVAPVGLLPAGEHGVTEEARAAIAQFQAALTHGHPTALAASDLTSAAIVYLVAGGEPKRITTYLRDYAASQRDIYHAPWLGPLWQRPGVDSPEEFIRRGWNACKGVLDRLDIALKTGDRETDPCLATGAGWIAEEAFATGLLCFLLFVDDPVKALRRAAVTSGDSDSIACLAGAFAGAYLGFDALPQSWVERIEYKDKLAELGVWLDTRL